MLKRLIDFFTDKSVLILGFGMEGKSTLKLLRELGCCRSISVADDGKIDLGGFENIAPVTKVNVPAMKEFDTVMKSPGIPLLGDIPTEIKAKITSQTDLLLRFCKNKVIGITGTKGKSTVSSLIYHILAENAVPSVLLGNIGIPPLDRIFDENIIIVCEMSCHQLEYVRASPNIAILLNIYEEHLDHYNSFEDYKYAKENIFRYRTASDTLICGAEVDLPETENLRQNILRVNFPDNNFKIETNLAGRHNLFNISVAIETIKLLKIPGIGQNEILQSIKTFKGLPHRLEKITVNGIDFINDSISTIPRAALFALEAFPNADTVIIGGMDRKISYAELEEFFAVTKRKLNVIALPGSGYRIVRELKENFPENKNISVYIAENLEHSVETAVKITKNCCVFSPAAASYGFYKNFEERGNKFKTLLEGEKLKKSVDK